MKIKAKYLGKTKTPTPFEDPDLAVNSTQFSKGFEYDFEIKGMTLYSDGKKPLVYTSLAHFLRNWTDVRVLSDQAG